MKLVVGITGASGLRLADTFLNVLSEHKGTIFEDLYLVVSENARRVASAENYDFNPDAYGDTFHIYAPDDFSAPFASGSFPFRGLVVIPASMSTIGSIAAGSGTNLIHRCADVCLKERKDLLLVPRETPFSMIHLENMTRLHRAGAAIVPFIPSFYNQPRTIDDMLHFFSIRLLDMLGIHVPQDGRWRSQG